MKRRSWIKKTALTTVAIGLFAFSTFAIAGPASAASTTAAPAPTVAGGTDGQADGCGGYASSVGNSGSTSDQNTTVADPKQSNDFTLTTCQGNATFYGITGLIGQASRSALTIALNRLGYFTTPQVTADSAGNGNWFISSYRMMHVMGLYILMPMVLIAIIHSIMKASLKQLLKSVFVFLPIAIIGTAVAINLVQLLLNITDDFSNVFVQSILKDANSFFQNLQVGIADPKIPLVLTLLMSVMLTLVSIFVFVILIVRESSIYLATAFLPIGFAMMVWPATAQWFKRMIEFLVGLILSKIVMVATISLAIAALTASSGSATAASVGLTADGGSSITSVNSPGSAASVFTEAGNILSAIALLAIVCWAPSMTVSLVAKLGVGEMSQHVGNALERPSGFKQLIFYDRVINMSGNVKSLASNATSGRQSAFKQSMALPSYAEQALAAKGIFRTAPVDPVTGQAQTGPTSSALGSYALSAQQLKDAGVDEKYHESLMAMTDPKLNRDNANLIVAANAAMAMGEDFDGFVPTDTSAAIPNGTVVNAPVDGMATILASKTGESVMIMNIGARGATRPSHVPRNMYRHVLRNEIRRQQSVYGENKVQGIHVIEMSRTTAAEGGRYGSVTGVSRAEDRRQRDLADATASVRSEFLVQNSDTRVTERPNIYVTYQSPAGIQSRLNRPLEGATSDGAPPPPS